MNVSKPIKKEEYELFRKELYTFKDGRELGVTFSVGLDADPSSNPKAIAEKLAHVQGFKDRALMILNRAVLGESFRKSAVKCIEAKYEAEVRRAMLNENVAKAKNQEMRGAEASKIAEAIIVKEVFNGEGKYEDYFNELTKNLADATAFLHEVQNIYDNLDDTSRSIMVQLKSVMVNIKVYGDGEMQDIDQSLKVSR